jgi:hypothetical protein
MWHLHVATQSIVLPKMDDKLNKTDKKMVSCVGGEDSYFNLLDYHRHVVWKVGIKVSKGHTAVIFNPADERSTFLEYSATHVAHKAILTM